MAVQAAFVVPHPPVIVPEIGKGRERTIQKTIDAYQEVARRIGELKPETIVVVSSHQTMYANYFHISPGEEAKGTFEKFQAGHIGVEASYDTEFVELLCGLAEEKKLPAGTEGETDRQLDHGTLVPLYFVGKCWTDCRLVRVGMSGLSLMRHYELGQCIREAAELLGRKTVVIASGDLSHKLKLEGPYGFEKEGPEYDSRMMYVLGRGDFGALLEFPEKLCNKAGECGHRAITIMAGTLDQSEVTAKRLSYEGPFGIGYGICEYLVKGENNQRNFKEIYEEKERQRVGREIERQDEYVRLARQAVEKYTRTGKVMEVPKGLSQELYSQKAGVFVSIKENGSLRGCIGTILPGEESLAGEIIHNAISAAARDPRFSPVEENELNRLTITVDVLGSVEKIKSPEELNVKRYGVIVTSAGSKGLLLPNLDGVDSVREQISIAKRKAGIDEREDVELERFEVVRHF
ncbi:MAG: AmmeMemoRadiSam system protein A [Lachnospiraceae bacterium]|jgi:AmmeMemoRadiSam system protein A|nr:AmmeMemoRadiSam system protein A [Lachnospiraceae bacterium]